MNLDLDSNLLSQDYRCCLDDLFLCSTHRYWSFSLTSVGCKCFTVAKEMNLACVGVCVFLKIRVV